MNFIKNETKILASLIREKQSTPSKLGRELGIKYSTITSITDSLDFAGYIKREASKTDRRSFLLTPTQKGIKAFKKYKEEVAAL